MVLLGPALVLTACASEPEPSPESGLVTAADVRELLREDGDGEPDGVMPDDPDEADDAASSRAASSEPARSAPANPGDDGESERDRDAQMDAEAAEEEAGSDADSEADVTPQMVVLRIRDPEERRHLAESLEAAGFEIGTADNPGTAGAIVLSDAPIEGPGIEALHVEAWATVVHQRHTVLDLSLSDLRAALTGAFPS